MFLDNSQEKANLAVFQAYFAKDLRYVIDIDIITYYVEVTLCKLNIYPLIIFQYHFYLVNTVIIIFLFFHIIIAHLSSSFFYLIYCAK